MLYGTGDKIYSTSYTSYGHTECSVTIRGNTTSGYTTTAFLSGSTPSNSSFSASSTSDFVTTVVPEGSTAFVTALAPDYWSASHINTNARNAEQWSAGHAQICSGLVMGHTYFTVESTAVGPRYFSAYMGVVTHLLNTSGVSSNQFHTYVKEPFSMYRYTGDPAVVGSGCIREYSGINVKSGTNYRYSAYSQSNGIKPGATFKDIYFSVADQGFYNINPLFTGAYEGVPFYILRSNSSSGTEGTAGMQYFFPYINAGAFENITWTGSSTAIEFPRTASGSGTGEWTCTETDYPGGAIWAAVDDPNQNRKVSVVSMGSSMYNKYYVEQYFGVMQPTCICVLFTAVSK